MNYKKPQRNNNLKETGKCLVYNFSLNTKEEMYYCGVEKTVNGNIYHMVKVEEHFQFWLIQKQQMYIY